MARHADPARLASFIRENGLSFRTNERSYIFSCPRCRKPDILYMLVDGGRFACMKCREAAGGRGQGGFQGAPEFALSELTGRSVSEVRQQLYGTSEVPAAAPATARFEAFADDDEEAPPEAAEEMPDLSWPYGYLPLDHPGAALGAAYLEGRGIPVPVAMQYDVRYAVEKRAVAFPFWVEGHLVGWQTRTIDPLVVEREGDMPVERVKSMSTKGLPRDKVLMFVDNLRGARHAVVCEGPVDAIKAHLVGGNVATAGKAVSGSQVDLILRVTEIVVMTGVRRVYLALDPDAANEIPSLLERLDVPDTEVLLVDVPYPHKDLGELSMEDAREAVASAHRIRRGMMFGHWRAGRLLG